jgi:charged multivesicular body protein 3
MKEVNSLVRLPELMGTMRELSQELVKAGIIEEMVGDMLPGDDLMEDEDDEAESEVEKVLGEILKDKTPQVVQEEHELPSAPVAVEEEEEEQEESMAEMRNRLEALRG